MGGGRCACVFVCVCMCVCPCVCVYITVYSPSAADHRMIKDCVHAAYSAVSSWSLHLCVCLWLYTYKQNINKTYNQCVNHIS